MKRPILTPLGSARAAVDPALGAPRVPFPLPWVELARQANLQEDRLHLAWELTSMVPARSGGAAEDTLGLFGLLVLLFDAMAQGSTRLAIVRGDRNRLRARARSFGFSAAELSAIERSADAIVALFAGSDPSQLALFGAQVHSDPLETLVGTPDRARPLVYESGALVPQRLLALETRLAKRLVARSARGFERAHLEEALAAVTASPLPGPRGPLVLAPEQRDAIRVGLSSPVALVSGGPGTGKTSIVVSMLRVLARLPRAPSVALAAPTGKAADRMKQSIERALAGSLDPLDRALSASLPVPQTLHRLLGYSPVEGGSFRHHGASPLEERVVIVDEASMIDLALMESLVAALGDEAQLVLLGDADQLPSVEAGVVFADLAALAETSSEIALPIATARLTRSHRMDAGDSGGAHVLGVAQIVRTGGDLPIRSEDKVPGVVGRRDRLDESGQLPDGISVIEPRDGRAREAIFAWWYAHRVRGEARTRRLVDRTFGLDDPRDAADLLELFDASEASRFLCVTRSRGSSTDLVNGWMGERLAREKRMVPGAHLLVGEPAMVLRNDYERGLFNGDQGLVLWVRSEGAPSPVPTFVVRRGARFAGYRLDQVRALLERAYASTVHKAQGSEHDAVALLLPEDDLPRLWTREILYTAITRARRSVLLIGDPAQLERAIRRPTARETWLRARVAQAARP